MSVTHEFTNTLRSETRHHEPVVFDNHPADSASICIDVLSFAQNQIGEVRASPIFGTLNTNSNATGRNSPLVYENHSQDSRYRPLGDVCETVNAVYDARAWDGTDISPTLTSRNASGSQRMPDKSSFTSILEQKNTGPLMANGYPDKLNHQDIKEGMYPMDHGQVRRLTPLECERLQGYPDGWTDIGEWTDSKGKKHKEADSPRYKALGNSIALPFWQWLLNRIAAECGEKTMVSLFDGIGGFPLCWQRAGGETLWISEIEEFPLAVTRERFK